MKIAICVPARDTVHTAFARSLCNLTNRLTERSMDFDVHFVLGTVIANSRNKLVNIALETDASHIFWFDSDMHVPTNTIEKLLTHDKDIVAAHYSTRYAPFNNVAFADPDHINCRLDAKTGLHKVWAVGMGCMLVKRSVYETLPKPWHNHHYNSQIDEIGGEDIWFCNQAMHHGFEVFVDAELGYKTSHFGTKSYKLEDIE